MPADGTADTQRRTPRRSGRLGGLILCLMLAICVGSLPWTLAAGHNGTPRFNQGEPRENRLPPSWIGPQRTDEIKRLNSLIDSKTISSLAAAHQLSETDLLATTTGPIAAELRTHWPTHLAPFRTALGAVPGECVQPFAGGRHEQGRAIHDPPANRPTVGRPAEHDHGLARGDLKRVLT